MLLDCVVIMVVTTVLSEPHSGSVTVDGIPVRIQLMDTAGQVRLLAKLLDFTNKL